MAAPPATPRSLPSCLAALMLAGVLAAVPGCRREQAPPTRDLPQVGWQGSWPVEVLSDPQLAVRLEPLDAWSATWLLAPERGNAPGWPSSWALGESFPGDGPSAGAGRARALDMHAAAWDALADLDAEALCRLGRSESAYGRDVPVGYLYGVEGCLWAGDAEGATLAWSHHRTFAPQRQEIAWPEPPVGIPTRAELAGRSLPHGGWADGDTRSGPPSPAFTAVYSSRDQDVEYAFVLPGDLWRVARWLEASAEAAWDACDGCPADARAWVDGTATADSAACGEPGSLLPLLVGGLPLAAAHVCHDGTPAAPGYPATGDAAISDLDGAAEAWLDGYLQAVEAEAVGAGTLLPEALPTIRDFARRAVYRALGLAALRAGDNEVALWSLAMAAGDTAGTAPRGANDPEMICSLALARFRAGHHRPAVVSLDEVGEGPGWEVAAALARTVARVETLPGADSVGVMR